MDVWNGQEINISSGNALMPSDNKPLTEPMLAKTSDVRLQWVDEENELCFYPLFQNPEVAGDSTDPQIQLHIPSSGAQHAATIWGSKHQYVGQQGHTHQPWVDGRGQWA